MSCRTLFSSSLLFAAACLAAPPILAQGIVIRGDGPPLPIDQATVNQVIEKVLKRLDDEYVFPDVAKTMAESIHKRQADHAYADIKTGQELAKRLTQDLQATSHDKHLHIVCSAQALPKPPRAQNPTHESPEMKARMRRRGEWINGGYRKVERMPGNIGYVAVDGFPDVDAAAGPAAAAMDFLANTDALIIDLRRNGGGEPETVALLCSYFFAPKPIHLNSLYWRKGNRTEEFWTLKEVAGKRYLGKDVYILTSRRTFSGGEEFAYDMQTQKRATLVGDTTGGGAHPGDGALIDDHFAMFVPAGRAINPITKTDWEGTGVKPDVAVPADEALEKAHEMALQKLLSNAKDEETQQHIRMDVERSRDMPDGKATTQAN
jgi:retinol-binding protein 3